MSVDGCCSSSFSSCSAFSSNPTQRNLRMSLTISLDAAGVCFAGISMIFSRVFLLLLHYVLPTSQTPTFVKVYSLKRKFLLKTFVASRCDAAYDGRLFVALRLRHAKS